MPFVTFQNIHINRLSYATNTTECSAAATEQWLSKSVKRSESARWDSTGDSKSLSLVELSIAAAKRSVGLVV